MARIDAAAGRLAAKLAEIDGAELPISELYKRILGQAQTNPTVTLQLFGYVLAWSLRGVTKPVEEATVVEVGAGMGMLSLLAREMGVGTVVYNDIYDIACRDARIVAERVDLVADHYIEGDLDDLIESAGSIGLSVDGIGSYDLIEHVYSIDDYLRRLIDLPGPSLAIAMASGANMYKPSYRDWIMPFQRMCELEGRPTDPGEYERDTLRAYVEVRREMIEAVAPDLEADELDRLATRTRGLRQDDIERATEAYLADGTLPPVLDHPTNTCDPYTGNWQEHLMDPDDLVEVLRGEGFDAGWLSGYFSGRNPNPLKRTAARAVNAGLRVANKPGIRIAPYYMVHGTIADKQLARAGG